MDQKKDNTKKYKSCSTGEECSAAQYVAELICTRKREKENKGSLAYKFWNNAQKEEYQVQIRLANKLIKKYGEETLFHFLKSDLGKKTYSLGFLHSSKKFVIISNYVKDGMEKSKKIIQERNKKEKKIIEVSDEQSYSLRPQRKQNTLLNKIRKIDNGKK